MVKDEEIINLKKEGHSQRDIAKKRGLKVSNNEVVGPPVVEGNIQTIDTVRAITTTTNTDIKQSNESSDKKLSIIPNIIQENSKKVEQEDETFFMPYRTFLLLFYIHKNNDIDIKELKKEHNNKIDDNIEDLIDFDLIGINDDIVKITDKGNEHVDYFKKLYPNECNDDSVKFIEEWYKQQTAFDEFCEELEDIEEETESSEEKPKPLFVDKWTKEYQKLPEDIQDEISSLSENIKRKKTVPQLTKEFIEILNTDKQIRKILGSNKDKFKLNTALSILSNRHTPKHTPEKKQSSFDKTIPLDDNNVVLYTKKSIKLKRSSIKNGDNLINIYDGDIEPLEKLYVDDFVVFRYKKSNVECTNTISNIIKQLKNEGGVLNKNLIDDCINAIFLGIPEKKGHATYGVYENNKVLSLCKTSMPLNDAQKIMKRKMDSIINNQILTKENLDPYLSITKFWHPYEVYPCMGLSAISPFALLLRKHHLMIFVLWHFSTIPRLGKSTVQWIFSDYLFGNSHVSGDSIDSKYRFASFFDSVGCALTIDEADVVNWNKRISLLKE